MESLIKSIVSKLHDLPSPGLHEVLNFVEFLAWQENRIDPPNISKVELEVNNQGFETLADQLADELIECVGENVPLLSDYAVSRAGIYEEHLSCDLSR